MRSTRPGPFPHRGGRVRHRHETHRLPYSAEQMFDLVADIERYPEFVPHWTHASIERREGNVLTVLQEIDLGIQRLRFESRAELQRPGHLQISSSAAPFRNLLVDWRFAPVDDGGCLCTMTVEVTMRSALMEFIADKLVHLITADVYQCFRKRAAILYPA